MKISIRKIYVFLVCVLVFLSFMIPRNISIIKLLIIVSALLIFYSSHRLMLKTNYTSTKFLFLYLAYSLWSSLHGFYNRNPEVYQLFRLNVIYFIMLYVWILLIRDDDDFRRVLKTCCWASIGISIYTLLFFAQTVHIINLPFFIYLDNASGAMIHNGYVHITNMNMSMMLFLFPVILFIYNLEYVKVDKSFLKLNRLAIVCSVIAMMMTGRRIVWIVLFGSLACYTIFKMEKSMTKKIWKVLIIFIGTVLAFIVLSKLFGISVDGFIDRFEEAFRERDNYGRENVRWKQLHALWKGFMRNPWFGSGAGVGVGDVIRSQNTASYELSYALILYNAGIIGFVPYILSLGLVLKKLWQYGKGDGVAKALFFGLAFGLVANATNPYFSSSFDFLLWMFIPLMYLNVYENNKISERVKTGDQEDSLSGVG